LLRNSSQKNVPPTFSHGERRWAKGLRTIINEGIAITNLTKKTEPHPSSPLERIDERMGGAINYN
jgi:hypothetical protein